MNKIVVENMLKEYFKNEREIRVQENKLVEIKEKIELCKVMLKESKIDLFVDLGCQQYSTDILGQGGKPTSKVEIELEKRYKQVEKFLEYHLRNESFTLDKIHNLNVDIQPIKCALKELSPIEIEILTKRYRDKETVKAIAYKMHGGVEKTTYRLTMKAYEKLWDTIEVSEKCPKDVREMSEGCLIS